MEKSSDPDAVCTRFVYVGPTPHLISGMPLGATQLVCCPPEKNIIVPATALFVVCCFLKDVKPHNSLCLIEYINMPLFLFVFKANKIQIR